jgi:hypothetical protein
MANLLDLPLNFANEKLPPVPEELIVWLKGAYPDRMPDDEDIEDIKRKQGQISVVRTLTSIYEEHQNVHE